MLLIINEGDEAKSINLSDGTHNFTCNVPVNGAIFSQSGISNR